MVCGEFGSPALIPYGKTISYLNALLSVLAVCFGIVGCVSYTNHYDAVMNAPWTVSKTKFKGTVYDGFFPDELYSATGIRSYIVYYKDGDEKKPFDKETYPNPANNKITTWKKCIEDIDAIPEDYVQPGTGFDKETLSGMDGYDRCVACDKASVAVVTMCSFALIAAAVAFLCHIMRATCDSIFAKDVSLLAGILAFAFGVSAFGAYYDCAMEAKKYGDSDYVPVKTETDGMGVGMKLTLGAFIVDLIILLFTLVTPVEPEQEAEAVPTGDITKI